MTGDNLCHLGDVNSNFKPFISPMWEHTDESQEQIALRGYNDPHEHTITKIYPKLSQLCSVTHSISKPMKSLFLLTFSLVIHFLGPAKA